MLLLLVLLSVGTLETILSRDQRNKRRKLDVTEPMVPTASKLESTDSMLSLLKAVEGPGRGPAPVAVNQKDRERSNAGGKTP